MKKILNIGHVFVAFFCSILCCTNTNAQTKKIYGQVFLQEDNSVLEDAIIALKNTDLKTTTDSKGQFLLVIPDSLAVNGILQINYKGYKALQRKLNGQTNVVIYLRKITTEEDVVVTSSYTKRRKEEVVGSISTVTAKELQSFRPIESFDKMLEGLAAGVQVEANTELGTPVKINIRGQSALNPVFTANRTALTTSSQPLFVIDGVPIIEQRRADEPIAFLNNEQLLNPLANINPDDIESISILKDAAAASIYGANASNGVIIITTKKGKAGKSRLNMSYSSGINSPINRLKMLTGQQYQKLLKELYINEGRDPAAAELLAGPTDINTDWFSLLNQRGSFNNVDMDMSGGSEAVQYRLSASYLNTQSIQKGNDFEKFFLRLRIDHQINNKFRFSVMLSPTITKKNALNTYDAVPLIPNVPVYDFDGSFYEPSRLGVPNPLAVINQNVAYHEGGSLNGNVTINYAATKTLSFLSSFGTDVLVNKLNLFDSPKNATGRTKNGFAQIYDRTNFSWINFNQVNYNPNIGKNHKLDITIGMEMQKQNSKLLRGSGTGFSYYRLNELSNAASQTSASSKQITSSASVYGQAQYNYLSKYFFNISGRYDAASIFGNDLNSTINNAFGIGWNLHKEKFLANSKWLTNARLRVSYGSTGNSRIGSFEARGLYDFSNTGYNGYTSASPSSFPNPNLTWEKNNKLNAGLEIGLFKSTNVSVDFYQNITKNAISLINIPPQNGFTNLLANIADMRNRGLDISINTAVFDRNNFKWNTTLNMGFNKNIILRVKDNGSIYSSNENATAVKAGASTSAIWGFVFAGVDTATGMEYFLDNNKNKVLVSNLNSSITNATNLGDRLPKLQGGFINNFMYKNFTLTVNILFNVGSYRLVNYRNDWNGRNLDNRNQSVNMLDRWQRSGDNASVPKLSRTTRFITNSSRYLYEDTYLKLSNIALGYTVPKKWLQKVKASNATVFLNATNIGYWYKEKSKKDRNGLAEYKFNFPEAQSFTWGVRIGF